MNQDQRELLELAAYAVGKRLHHFNDAKNAYWIDEEDYWWNSLANKADAFDLMVKLRLFDVDELIFSAGLSINDGNPDEVVMLALTRAAAAVGKQMKEQVK